MSESGKRKLQPGFTVAVDYAPDVERMLRTLLLALGEPPEEINRLLALRRGRGDGESPKSPVKRAENAPPERMSGGV